MTTYLALVFLVGCVVRLVLYFFDTGFGGPMWDVIFYASTLTWLAGAALSVFVLLGWTGVSLSLETTK